MRVINLNTVELAVGFFIQLPFYYLIGLWVFPLAIISGLLWSLGGAENSSKLFRRIGVPASACIFLSAFYTYGFTYVWIALIPAVIACSIGYGLDSWMWRFFYNHNGDHKLADYLTRLATYILYWLSFGIVLLFVK